jgi:serine/tyrosine/threonine adenylyltransferase
MFYDGRPDAEPGAIVCRVAPSFVRFGNFEIHARLDEIDVLRRLTDHVITTHFPDLGAPGEATYLAFFEEVSRRTALLAAHWTRVGFVHGVLNTDNMSVLGVTIDYGPYGWLEGYDPNWTPNTTDASGRRYRFGQQPNIALWNLARLGEALSPLLDTPDALNRGLEVYRDTFDREYGAMLRDKLGLDSLDTEGLDPLLANLFALLEGTETDMTLFFRGLADVPVVASEDAAGAAARLAPLRRAFYDEQALDGPHGAQLADWLAAWAARVRQEARPHDERVSRMQRANPKYVLRNYLAQLAIDAAAQGDTSVIERLLHVLSRPYDDQPEHDDLAEKRPEWARHRAGCSMLSCSS